MRISTPCIDTTVEVQVPSDNVRKMEAQGNVCYMYLGCAAIVGPEQERFYF